MVSPAPWAAKSARDAGGSRAVEAELARLLETAKLETRIDEPAEYRLKEARQLIEMCERELARTDPRSRAESHRVARLHYEMARQYEHPLGALAEAADHYKKAHSAWPEFVPAIRGARRVLGRQGQYHAMLLLLDAEIRTASDPKEKARLCHEKGRILDDRLGQGKAARDAFRAAVAYDATAPVIVDALERAERAASAWVERDAAVEKLSNLIVQDPRHRASLVGERARSAEVHQGDESAAVELYRGALSLDPHASGALPALKRLLYAHKRWGDLVSTLTLEAELSSDPQVRALALFRAARIQYDRLGQVKEAIASLENGLRSSPDDLMILEELARLYELAQRYDSMVLALERIVALGKEVADRAGLLHRIGRVYEEHLSDVDAAIKWYAAELAMDPASLPALQALARLYTEREAWTALIEVHAAEAVAASDPERRAAAYAKVAELYEVRLNDGEQATAYHAHALGVVPGYPPSVKALSRLYALTGNSRALIELSERLVDLASDNETRITHLFKIGRLYEDALSLPSHAFTAYRRVLEVDPKHLGAMHAIQRSAERANMHSELVEALELEAKTIADRKAIVALHHQAGEVLERKLNDPEAAIERYRRVIEIDPRYEPALVSLGRVYEAAGRWQELVEVYEHQLAIHPKGLQAAVLWCEIGAIQERRLGRDDKALEAYRKAVELEPAHAPSARALERRLAQAGQWLELIRLLERSAEQQSNDAIQARLLFRAGEIYEHRLAKLDRAMVCFDRAVALVPDFRPAIDGRARLLSQQRDWQKLVEALGEEADHTRDPALAVAALMRQAELLRDELGQPERAITSFESVLQRSPEHLGALLGVSVLYAAAGKWEQLVRVLSVQARIMKDPQARVAALKTLANVTAAHGLADAAALRQIYTSILQLSAGDSDALLGLESMAIESGDAVLLGQVDAQLMEVGDSAVAAAHRTRLAEALEVAGDSSALSLYREAVRLDPENLAALRGITRLARRSGDAAGVEAAAENVARIAQDTELAGTLLVEAAALHVKAGDGEAALRALRRALEVAPEHELAARSLRELMLMAGRIQELLDSLIHAAQSAPSKERASTLWAQVAELQAETLHDVPAAVATLQRVMKLMPGHQATLMRLADLYASDSQWAAAVDVLKRALPAAVRAPEQAAIQLRLAIILDEHLKEPKAARDALNAVLTVEPSNAQALERMLSLQVREKQYDQASKTALRLIDAAGDDETKARALGHRAELERRLGRTDEAFKWYQEAVAMVGGGRVAARFRAMLEQQRADDLPSWQGYAGSLMSHLEKAPASADVTPTCLELGRTLCDNLGQPEQAVQALEHGLKSAPSSVELRLELAHALRQAGKVSEAVDALRRALDTDTRHVTAWRDLARAFGGAQRTNEALAAIGALVVLGEATEEERAALATRPSRPASAAPGSVDESLIAAVRCPKEIDTGVALLASFHDGLPKIFATEFERYGLTSRDRIGARAGHPLRNVVDRTAAILGVAEVDLYVYRAPNPAVTIEFSETPSILVADSVGSLPEAMQVFIVSRVMANMARRIQVVDRLAPPALELLLTAAARGASSTFGAGKGDEEYLVSQAKRINKSLGWGRRGALEETAQAYVARPVPDVAAWFASVRLTAARVSLLICDDLPAAIDSVRRTEGDLAGVQGEALARSAALIDDLMRFWVSDSAFAARRRLGAF